MATVNPFDLLGNDAEDPSQLAVSIVPAEKTDKLKKSGPVSGLPAKSADGKLPSKPLPPAQAVREARSDAPRGGGRGFNRGRGGYNRDFGGGDRPGGNNGFSGGYSKSSEEGDVSRRGGDGGGGGARGSIRGGRRGGSSNEGGDGERPRRTYERRSGTGRGGDFKRLGSGRGNWGTPGEEVFVGETEEVAGVETEKDVVEKPAGDDVAADASKENADQVAEEKEQEDKEMTLDEYEKILEEKKKALQYQTTSERKVDTKEFESMQQLSNKKKSNDEIFIKLGSDKDKRKDEKEEKAKKAVSINEFLKPAEGENYYRGGRGGRGRGGRVRGGVSSGGFGGYRNEAAPAIGDSAQFPSLGGK
uniref:Hyaluronan/mRNA-binding protein domain-containing protein n=1 Tax=Noccaea caerulescens TaxID=107243 RepID=A0A1J3DXY8_NOCCA